ncbi:50S ribosomal protein L3 N(5)-glutamine methyltransferase [Pusillimonas minor]|uniref:Ribosomal protein uL3 glutamine methyltransferase n=1 Tax=Pusillimonas minor TaxID=2697024 RepID=A0A842HRD6_9BURK|nr:50S ribosomal protein L3 N(5)-glutamine methyltransferase [Pusillimonas minor]MBC2770222.1 50S ribosomal protein L3 N(5)-glutamine methyltransferase [Pusillimonas minor]
MNSSAYQELHTVRDLLRYTVSQFNAAKLSFGHGSDNAWDEAVYLLLHVLHLPLDTLDPFLDARVLPEEREKFLNLVARRLDERVPAAYLTGEAWLQGHRFVVDPRVIIPRSPISELLAEQLSPWVTDPDAVDYVLDLCTGSGCLAVLAALAFPGAQVDAVDLSEHALEVADQNIELLGVDGRVTTHRSDLFDQLPDCQYNVIVCNPPYVNSHAMESLPPEYRHEPTQALAGGPDGMDLVRRIVRDAPRFMAPEGILVLEIGNEYENFINAFPELDPVWLSTENAEDQILMLTREQLQEPMAS